eukprot:3933811-Rhodomonas_salina.3
MGHGRAGVRGDQEQRGLFESATESQGQDNAVRCSGVKSRQNTCSVFRRGVRTAKPKLKSALFDPQHELDSRPIRAGLDPNARHVRSKHKLKQQILCPGAMCRLRGSALRAKSSTDPGLHSNVRYRPTSSPPALT